MAAKRSRADLSLEAINSVFETLISLNDPSNDDYLSFLKKGKDTLLSDLAEEMVSTRRQAKSFTLEEAVETFGLTYREEIDDEKHFWKIDTMPDFKPIEPTECFSKVSP